MEIKCGNCGHKTIVTISLIKAVIGGGIIFGDAAGWVTYAFAGLLGFYGGAALIAGLLLAGGSAVLVGKDLNFVVFVAQKITYFLNNKGYRCEKCGAIDWQFSGFEDAEVIAGFDHLECDIDSNPEVAFLKGGVEDWQLLLQLDCDRYLDWEWENSGMLYFWIRTQDLENRDFSNVWCEMQCT